MAEYWLNTSVVYRREVHPDLLDGLSKSAKRRLKLYAAVLFEDEDLPSGKIIEFAIDAKDGVARGLMRYQDQSQDIDVAINVISFPCPNDPEMAAKILFEAYATAA